jgi:hypothetical protein
MKKRCKMTCQSVKRTKAWTGKGFHYTAEFQAVADGSDENKAFWEATPNGSLTIVESKESTFEPGESYYIDITPCAS